MNPYTEFTCLYTSQKQKKAKTWQDGHLRFFLNNSKVVLYDAKFNVLDSTFHRGNAIAVGDDMDMDRHLITVEGLTEAYASNSIDQRNNTRNAISRSATIPKSTTSTTASTLKSASTHTKTTVNGSVPVLSGREETARQPMNDTVSTANGSTQTDLKRRKWRPPILATETPTSTTPDSSLGNNGWEALDQFDLEDILSEPMNKPREPSTGVLDTKTGNTTATSKSTALTPIAAYKDGMTFLIYEHMQIMVIEIAIAMWSIKSNPGTQDGVALDTLYRSRGIHMHSDSTLRRRGDTYSGFPLYNDGASNGGGPAGTTAMALQPTSQLGLSLSISNKEHHSNHV
ncbi:hypothetical protein BGZ80_009882 [Entomortierella chlamydospora]|uniref:5'-3' DNA helicase ZGRF1-like N-terminal domain-containing protein n=1 Tax=Entomortierella chlamydospora TaxID=101097 RepID=A0A9P6T055_9FUNG|nr:hypothetical protein BGZ80_009882 [Entomortierella chlamydospora]